MFKNKNNTIKGSAILVLLAFVISIGFVLGQDSSHYFTSVIHSPTSQPFDGTTLPVLRVPKWTALTSSERSLSYDDIPSSKMISIPKYDPSVLAMDTSSLGWTSSHDLGIRNAKITYSVPYMGNYKLDGKEYAGSHLAVDIKIPVGTPIYAIANGVVTKVSSKSSGFGKHIVVKHTNVPSLKDPNKKVTLYSNYCHLSEILVAEGDVVTKGQLIGKSGDSGFATTPHIHFQIDNDSAPWHPYWPFTSKEASDAGYSFVEAINAGFHKDRALKTTVNPMLYVQKYSDFDFSVSDTKNNSSASKENDIPPKPVVEDKKDIEIPPKPPIKEKVVNKTDDTKSSNENTLSKTSASKKTSKKIESKSKKVAHNDIVKVTYNSSSKFFKDVSVSHRNYKAIKFLKDNNIIAGYPDNTFRPLQTVTRVEALKFILKSISAKLITSNSLPFSDTDAHSWYSPYVATAYNQKIIAGYDDKTFKPANKVNKAEFLKMLFTAMDIELPDVKEDVYRDVKKDDWFAPYVLYAKNHNLLVISNNLFHPDAGISRAEVAEIMYRTILVKLSNAPKYSSGIVVSKNVLRAYFG